MQIRSQVRKDQRVVLFVSATAKQVVRDYSSCAPLVRAAGSMSRFRQIRTVAGVDGG
jgi:hypothetical protein